MSEAKSKQEGDEKEKFCQKKEIKVETLCQCGNKASFYQINSTASSCEKCTVSHIYQKEEYSDV